MRRLAMLALAAVSALLVPSMGLVAAAGETPPDSLLIDYGNGSYEWVAMGRDPGGTLISAISSTLADHGIGCTEAGGSLVSVGNVRNTVVGDRECEWRIFIWDSFAWVYGGTDGTETYDGGTLAAAFYPSATILPAATPLYPETWTSFRGDSSASGICPSTGPANGASPLEWYVTSTSGGVYGTVLCADGLIYYITGGNFFGSGVDRNPHLFCVDTVNHDKLWSFTYTVGAGRNFGYEIGTPIIVGDMLIVTSANKHVYCLDRFEGTVLHELLPEGDEPHYASVFNSGVYSYEPIADGTWTMEGLIFANGPTTAVYDSGALYFNTHDGAMRCYSIDRERGFEELWTCIPEKSQRGCFYFNPPTIGKIGERRVVLSGSYSGNMYCVDASSGEMLSIAKIADLGPYGTGVVSRITPVGDAAAIVTCDDGAMSPRTGFTALVDLRDASMVWKVDLFTSSPAVVGETVYAYLKPSVGSLDPAYEKAQIRDKYGNSSDAYAGFYALSLSDGHQIWCNENAAYTKSGLVFCDGRLYCIDYGTSHEWPNGGALRCLDPDTGEMLWSVRLKPGTAYGYSMSTPSVVGGKVYVGNDDGTVYCVSDVPGVAVTRTSDIDYRSKGLMHWSWMVLFVVAETTLLVAFAAYER